VYLLRKMNIKKHSCYIHIEHVEAEQS